jgi:hypothetical protein
MNTKYSAGSALAILTWRRNIGLNQGFETCEHPSIYHSLRSFLKGERLWPSIFGQKVSFMYSNRLKGT